MGDSTVPLLSPNDDDSSKKAPSTTLDETIERCIGEFGSAQFLQAILVSIAWVFDAQQTFIRIFTDAEPTSDQQPFASVISDWGHQSASSFIKGLPASSFFMGCLAGGLVLATLADSSLGRKNTLFLSCLLMSFSYFLIVFSSNIWFYSALKFINGVGRATIGTSALVLSTELVGKRWRGQVGVIGFFLFTLGFLSLPLLAYINRDSSWKSLYLWTSIPTMFYCVLVWLLVRESPRWLLVRGRKEEAVSTLKSIAPLGNNSFITMSFLSDVAFPQDPVNDNFYSAIRILLQRKWAVRRLSAVMVVVFGIGMVYYGMPLGLGNLSFNLYLSVTLNALSEIPSSLITLFLVDRLNRKSSVLLFTALSGICSVLCEVMGRVSTGLQIGLELASFFSACSAFNIALIYTIELFPTCVRNSALSMVRQALVLGGVFSPVLVAAGRRNGLLTYGVFGVCGLFVVRLP